MTKRILIIEDNSRDFLKMVAFFEEKFPEIDIYPKSEEENKILKKHIKQYFSPATTKKENAEEYINNLNFNSFDGIILDYVLDGSFQGVNGISLYNSLNLQVKALVLTKLTAVEFKKIETQIETLGLRRKIKAIQKGASNNLTKEQKAEYEKTINQHIFNKVEQEDLPKVVILTALKEEYIAVRSHLSNIQKITKEGTIYEIGYFKIEASIIAQVIIRECGAGTSIASQETERAILNFTPKVMFFVGIAGSRKPSDFKVGDVIIGRKIYSYEGGKAEKDQFLARPELESITYALNEVAKSERLSEDWKKLIKVEYCDSIKADLGVIASGNQLIEHYDSNVGQIIKNNYNDTAVIEMEGYAFAMAAKRQNEPPSVAIIRGISDIVKQGDEINVNDDRRPDNAKHLASHTAAAFTFWLIYKYYTNQTD